MVKFLRRAWYAMRQRRLDAELAEEMDFHRAMKRAELERSGLPADAAEFASRRALGNQTLAREDARAVWIWRGIDDLWRDIAYSIRSLGRDRIFTAVAVLSLALGIGANTAIFSLINTLMLRMLPVREPDQVVELLSKYPGEPRMNYFGWKFYERFRDENHVFSDLVGVAPFRFQVSGEGFDAEAVDGEYVVGTFFPTLGMQPGIGRLIGPQDDQLGAADAAVAVVSWSYWRNRFNLDPAILGKRISVNGVPAAVVGVTPQAFSGLQVGSRTDVWVPVAMEPLIQRPSRRADGTLGMKLIGRLKPGVSLEQAVAEMTVLDQWRVEEIARTSRDPRWREVKVEVARAGAGFSALRDQFAKPLLVLMAVAGLLLLIACTNVASILLARGTARQREMAVRVALGAGRLRLVRQVLTESLLLAAAGGLLGVFLAYFGADALVRIMTSGRPMIGFERLEIQVQPDVQVLLFTAGVALITGVLFGLAPAWNAFASAPASSLREIGGAGDTRSRRLFGKSLIVVQVALSVVLLSAAGLFVGHLSNLRNLDLGFDRHSVLLVTLNPQGSGYNRVQLSRLYRDLLQRLQAIPGVRSASLSGATPIEGAAASRFANVEGFQEKPEERRRLMLNGAGPRYFETLGTPLIAGRDFQVEDAGRPRVAIVNQAMARYYFGGGSPIGKHVTFDGDDMPYEIVGIVGDAKYLDLHEAAPRTVYLNAFQDGFINSQFSLRTDVPPTAIVGEVRRAVSDVLKTVRVAKVTTLAEQVDASIVPERLIALLAGFFGVLGASLAAIGLYGLLAYTVARRTSEIGIRMSLGATERDVARMVLKGALGLVLTGLVVGAPIALWSRAFTARLIDNLPANNAYAIGGAALAMIALALLASYLPARRAMKVDPMVALRCE